MESTRAVPVSPMEKVSADRPHQQHGETGVPDVEQLSWATHRRGRWTWEIHPDFRRVFEGPEGVDLPNLRDNGRAQRIKMNDGREVWRFRSGSELFFIKIGRPGRRWPRMRKLLMGCPADRERRIAAYAATQGIDTVRPVAVAQAPIAGRKLNSVFVTIGVTDVLPLNECWSGLDPRDRKTRQIKNQIIDAAAKLIAPAHQNGFAHFDLHAGNVLIQQRDGVCRALFVDLHNVRTGRPVNDRAIVRNLAQFNQWFRLHANLTDRLRFLKRYIYWHGQFEHTGSYSRCLGYSQGQMLEALRRAACKHADALYAKRDRRAMRSGRYFAKLALGNGWRAHVYLAAKHRIAGSAASGMTFTKAQWEAWLDEPTRWFKVSDRNRIIKDSRTAMVCRGRLETQEGPSLEVVCKRSLPRTLFKRVQHLFRISRPMQTWKRANSLLNRQIATARPLAVVERRRFGLLTDSFVITEYLEHAMDLDTLLTVRLREEPGTVQRRVKRQIVSELASVIRQMHERGYTHRDLKAPNVMVQWSGEIGKEPRVLLVDLDGLKRAGKASAAKQIRALTRLNISLDHCKRATVTDRVRFLRAYLARPGNPDPKWKPLWREIATQSDQKRKSRHRQQQKMLAKYGRF